MVKGIAKLESKEPIATALKLFNENQNQESAEFDGLVICPRVNTNNPFAHIIEAKNYNNGVTDARNQLNNRVRTHLISELEMNIVNLMKIYTKI